MFRFFIFPLTDILRLSFHEIWQKKDSNPRLNHNFTIFSNSRIRRQYHDIRFTPLSGRYWGKHLPSQWNALVIRVLQGKQGASCWLPSDWRVSRIRHSTLSPVWRRVVKARLEIDFNYSSYSRIRRFYYSMAISHRT